MTALGNGVSADRILREWLARHPASMLIRKSEDEGTAAAREATRLRLVAGAESDSRR